MTSGWKEVGRLARLRRERLGLKQEDLRLYGGPKVSTVGKLERGAQENFPLRTQHQMEAALGWPHGAVEDVLNAIATGDWDTFAGDFEEQLVDSNIPALVPPAPGPGQRPTRAADLSDEELLAELTYRLKRYRALLEGGDGHAEEYRSSASMTTNPIDLPRLRTLVTKDEPRTNEPQSFSRILPSALGSLDPEPVAAHDEEHDIEDEQGHPETP